MTLNKLIGILFGAVLVTACSIGYSFKAEKAPVGNIFIGNFYNNTSSGPPFITQSLTEKTKEYFQQNAKSLTLVQSEEKSDFDLTGTVSGYNITPISPSNEGGVETSSLMRLQVTVSADFLDKRPGVGKVNTEGIKLEDLSYKKDFTFYSDYPSERQLSDVEDVLIEEIFDQIAYDMFAAAFGSW